MRTREGLPDRSPITPGQARLTLEFLRDGLPEKKLQLVGMSILLILLSPGLGCYSILLEQLGHSLSYFRKLRDEAPIITSKSKELTNLMH